MTHVCDWCHTEVPARTARRVRDMLAGLQPAQRAYVAEAWGRVPDGLCARDFNQLVAETNRALFDQRAGALP